MYIKDLLCELQYQVAVENGKKKEKKESRKGNNKKESKWAKDKRCKL